MHLLIKTKQSIRISAFLIFSCFLSVVPALAVEKPVSIRISSLAGYDNNSGLNAERKGDGFAQENVAVVYQRLLDNLLNKKAQMRLSYNVLNNNYFEATDQNILAHNAVAGLNILLDPITVLETSYSFDFFDFSYNSAVNSYSHEGRVGLRRRVGPRWVVKGGFSASTRDYEEKKLRRGDGLLSDDERSDNRYTFDSLVLFKLRKDVTLNAGAVIYWNDSNDFFHDYYDYKTTRFVTGASWDMNPKLSTYIKLIYERRTYNARPLIDFSQTLEKDDVYAAHAALFYKLRPDLSLGWAYIYSQKNSNEPSQKYSSSTGTLGLYYSF